MFRIIAAIVLIFGSCIGYVKSQVIVPTVDATGCTPGMMAVFGIGGAGGGCIAVPAIFAFNTPVAISPVFGTAYAATNPAKPAILSVMVEAAYTVSLANTQSDTVELRIGPNATTVANGTGGTAVATFKNSLTGIVVAIGMGTINRNQLTAALPVGWFYAVRRVAGTTATIPSAYDQAVN